MTTRLTGLASGLDTESIIKSMLSNHQTKVDTAKGDQKKLEWKKEAWSALNTKLYSFYTGALSKFKSVGTYKAKKVATTNDKAVTVNASNNAVVGSHTLSVHQVASSAYLTSASLKGQKFNTTSYVADADAAGKQLSDLVDSRGNQVDVLGKSFSVAYTDADGNEQTKTITTRSDDGTLQSVIDNMNADLGDIGLEVSYDTTTGGFKFANSTASAVYGDTEDPSKITGYEGGKDFTIKAADDASAAALGISASGITAKKQAAAEDTGVVNAGNVFNKVSVSDTAAAVTGSTKLTDMGIAKGTTYEITVGKGENAKTYSYTIDQNTTLSGLAKEFSKMGVQANYDEKMGTFFVNSTESGEAFDFELKAYTDASKTSESTTGLTALGLDSASATKIDGQDAIVVYNGATFQQSSNDFSLNGLSFTANDVTVTKDEAGNIIKDDPIKMNVSTDTDAIYNAVKDFVKEYNALIKEMNTLYSAESAKDYAMLTDEKKEAMSDKEVEDWENKIKASLLRRDPTINKLLSTMRSSLNKGVNYTGSDGIEQRYSLSAFGITTGTWNEYGQLHIEGDADDSAYSGMTNKLKNAIAENPDALIATLNELGTNLYENFQKAMKSSSLSSALTFYNDKQIDSDITKAKKSITSLTEKMNAAEDRYYKQFAAMETALATLQTQQSSMAGFFGS